MKQIKTFAFLLATIALAGCSEAEVATETTPRPVLSTLVETRHDVTAGFTGTVEARVSTDIGFRLLGRITSRAVNVGDLVQAGQELMTLDATSLRFAVSQAEADLASERAKVDLARVTVERRRLLLTTNATTAEQVEEAERSIEAALATVRQREAELTKAREQLTYATLVAETSGVVSAISGEVGQVVAAGQTVVTIAQLDALDAVVDIPDGLVPKDAASGLFSIVLQANPSISAKGSMREVAPQADSATRSRRTKIAVDDPAPQFRLGSTVTVIPLQPEIDNLWLPATAVGTAEGSASFVWIVDAATHQVNRRAVEVAAAVTGGFNVINGLSAGERVVTAGVNSLTEGQIVSLLGETTP